MYVVQIALVYMMRAALGNRGKSLGVLSAVLVRAVQQRMGEFNAQDLANTARAFATTSQSSVTLFESLARATEW